RGRLAHFCDPLDGAHTIARVRALIVHALPGISTYDHEIPCRFNQTVAGPGRQHDHVTRFQIQDLAFHSAALDPGAAASYSHHFVHLRMIVHKVVNRISPGPAPTVRFEQGIHHHACSEGT